MRAIPEGTMCENCDQRLATSRWIGDSGTLAITRSYMQTLWCEICVLSAQVEHAEECAEKLPAMRERLAAARVADVTTPPRGRRASARPSRVGAKETAAEPGRRRS